MPDVFLSLGTGLSRGGGAKEPLRPGRSLSPSHDSETVAANARSPRSPWKELVLGMWMGDSARADCELKQEEEWHQYSAGATAEDDSYRRATGHSRNERLNISFKGQRPKFDEEKALDVLEAYARSEILKFPSIKRIAQKLLASCFYFEISPKAGLRVQTGQYECSGKAAPPPGLSLFVLRHKVNY